MRGFVIVGKAALGPGCSDNWWDNTWCLSAVLTASQCPSWRGKLGLGHPMAMFKVSVVYQNDTDNAFFLHHLTVNCACCGVSMI